MPSYLLTTIYADLPGWNDINAQVTALRSAIADRRVS